MNQSNSKSARNLPSRKHCEFDAVQANLYDAYQGGMSQSTFGDMDKDVVTQTSMLHARGAREPWKTWKTSLPQATLAHNMSLKYSNSLGRRRRCSPSSLSCRWVNGGFRVGNRRHRVPSLPRSHKLPLLVVSRCYTNDNFNVVFPLSFHHQKSLQCFFIQIRGCTTSVTRFYTRLTAGSVPNVLPSQADREMAGTLLLLQYRYTLTLFSHSITRSPIPMPFDPRTVPLLVLTLGEGYW